MNFYKNKNKLLVYIEGRKRREFVGHLIMKNEFSHFVFEYDRKYLMSSSAIPLGPDIPLSKIKHESKDKLFPSFKDRIPSRNNPAYKDYCKQQGISEDEENPIILLGAIGKRGPSSFVFEPDLIDSFDVPKALSDFRKELGLSYHDLALVFNMNVLTLQRIEREKSQDSNIIALIKIYLTNPRILLELLELTGGRIHHETFKKIRVWILLKIS